MKRNPRKLKWTKASRKSAGKEMVVNSTLTFAARCNVPVRYKRDLVSTTLTAMRRISEIRQRRERVFYKKRMEGNKEREKTADRKLVAESEHLLPKLTANRMAVLTNVHMEGKVEGDVSKQSQKTTVFGMQKIRRKVLVGGGVEDEMDTD
jgi:large subunit ribosomal protein L24e